MAIYKLGEICNFQRGQQDKNFSLIKTIEKPYPIISAGKNIKGYYQNWNRSKGIPSISSSGANAGFITIPNENYYAADCFSVYSKNEQKIKQRYLNLILLKFQDLIFNFQRGSGQPHVYPKDVSQLESYIPSLEQQQKIIDIIEPVECLLNQVIKVRNKLLNFIKNLPLQDKKERISYFLEPIKNKPKHLNQISAKVLNEWGVITELEDFNTYKTNNFFTPKGTFVFCSIRTYLRKWGLIPYDVDSNGTLFQFSIKNNITSLIAFLINNNSWEKFNLLSSGTKMPVIKKEAFLNVEISLKSIEIKNIDQILISLNRLQLEVISLKKNIVKLLIK